MPYKQYTNTDIVNMYCRSSRGIRSVARMMGLPKTRVGRVINQYQQNGRISYNNYISARPRYRRSWR